MTDLHLLLGELTEPLPREGYRRLIVDENRLARGTSAAREKLWTELRSRYRLDVRDDLFQVFWREWQRSKSEEERDFTAYVLLALNDRLVADLATDFLFDLLRRAPAELRVNDVLSFISRQARAHPEVERWSEKTTTAVAQKYCATIRDFRLAKGTVRKVTVRPALYGAPTRLLVRALRLAGTPVTEVVRSRIFRLVAIDSHEVIDALAELNESGALRFRIQGDVVELDLDEAA